ncbi:cupin domain-containing protein [Blastococcus sp. CT_GayMR16]|uniref:cupin domain-containing protein n=1 Tax=Blastococcus sp. CT_GayMR16 TaxID=2559607 RepID=UPI00107404BD|nr:cupin domain-containing protein [Blastococcus sp. CT_GayMR16]TFV87208.1 cupin domain-containing protein [Blastococcus sp. CT_GayMR16]
MDDEETAAAAVRILRASDGDAMGDPAGVRDRFMIDGEDAGGRFALVQHLFPPRALLAPVHLHHLEDEYTYVLSGRIGGILGEEEVFAEPGDLVFKPRNQWHTLWNAGDEPAAVLELISPAGLETFFRWVDSQTEFPTPEVLAEMAAPYRCDVDPERTGRIVEQHGLTF